MNVAKLVGDLSAWWTAYGYQVVLGCMAVVTLILAVGLFQCWRRGRVDRWVSTVTGIAVLVLSSEGMWVIARERLELSPILAASVFFVGEAALVQSFLQAKRHYEATTERDENGKVVKPGTPGKHGRAVWIIAVVIGGIVALNSKSYVEFPLRLALPLGAAFLWWNSLTAEGTGEAERSSWRWTPRRFLLWIGALEPGDRDMETINRDRVIASMTLAADRYHSGGRAARWVYGGRLRRLARSADDAIVDEVASRVERVQRIAELTDPAARAAARGEVEALREAHAREVEQLQAVHAAEVAELGDRLAALERAASSVDAGRDELLAQHQRELEAIRRAHADEVAQLRAALDQGRQMAATFEKGRANDLAALRGEIDRLGRELSAAGARARAQEQQADQLRREVADLRQRSEGLRSDRDAARAEVSRLTTLVDELRASASRRPVAPAAPVARSGGGLVGGSAGVGEPAGRASRSSTSRPVPEPVASAGSAAPARAVAAPVGVPGPDAPAKVRVFAVLDELAPADSVAPRDVVAAVLGQVPDVEADTAARYLRDWRREVNEGRRQLGARRLRVVPPKDR